MASGKCYHHPSQDAVAQCRSCGKEICKNCYEVYGVANGEYADQVLCFDCTSQLVESNVAAIDTFREKTKKELIIISIGAIIGGILIAILMGQSGGAGSAVGGFILGALLGGSALMVLKGLGAMLKAGANLASGSYLGFFAGIIGFFKAFFVAPIATIVKTVTRMRQIKKANEIITNDAQALAEMRDYFAYTKAMEENVGVELAKLADQGGTLFENTYAKAILSKGEKTAQEELRQNVVQIAANDEIIKGFDKKPKKGDKEEAKAK